MFAHRLTGKQLVLIPLAIAVFAALGAFTTPSRALLAESAILPRDAGFHPALPIIADLGFRATGEAISLERFALPSGAEELLIRVGSPDGFSEQRIRIEWCSRADSRATLLRGSPVTRIEVVTPTLYADVRTDGLTVGRGASPGGSLTAGWPSRDPAIRGIRDGLISQLLPRAERLIDFAPKP